MTLPGVLNQPSLQTSQPLVSLQLSVSSATSPAAILTTPSPMNSASLSVSSTAPKQNQTSLAPSVAGAKVVQSVLRPIQPRPASPPIKVPHYTINHNHNTSSQVGACIMLICSFFLFLFFVRSPTVSLGFTTFVWDFCVCDRFFNPTIKVVTFRLRGWCVLGVFLLPAFTRLGHECQDLFSLCDEMHVCSD